MKYRHAYHAGNFADVHKHVALLALLGALKRKDKAFLYLETHAGRGLYAPSAEAPRGIERLGSATLQAEELRGYADVLAALRSQRKDKHAYPGSPLIAAQALRAQDRAIFVELEPTESRALELATREFPQVRVERDDGFARLRAHLPPHERRGLTFIDPPYEETTKDFARVESALALCLEKFATGVVAAWYPIKEARDITSWHAHLVRKFSLPLLVSELWLYPRDSRVALNGSGLVILNAPYQIEDRMRAWLPELLASLDADRQGGWRVTTLTHLV